MNDSLVSRADTHSSQVRVIAGLLAGLIGGLMTSLIVNPAPGFLLNLLISALLGAVFALLLGSKIDSLGAGFVWGEAFGLFWWLIGSLTLIPMVSGQGLFWTVDALQAVFPILLAQIVANGAILGMVYYLLAQQMAKVMPAPSPSPSPNTRGGEKEAPSPNTRGGEQLPSPSIGGGVGGGGRLRKVPMSQAILPPLFQQIIIGAVGGIVGSWVFLRGIDVSSFLPLIAGLAGGSDSMLVGELVHYVIGTIIGVTFAILFSPNLKGSGSGLIWGMNYGLFWWIIGPQTLLPLLRFGQLPTWSLEGAQTLIASLMAHLLYGSLVGLFVSLANNLWNILFVDSDPLNRTREGAGARGLRGILMGQAGGIIGGLLFTIVMIGVGALPGVASLIGAESFIAGFIVHLIIAITIGTTYGLLFQREAYNYGAGMAWGLLYGLLWWLIGTNTLFNILLRLPVDWSLTAIASRYPALVGHLLYGAGLGLFYQYLVRRYDSQLNTQRQQATQPVVPSTLRQAQGTASSGHRSNSSAPALWAVVLTLGVMLPLLLTAGDAPQPDTPTYGGELRIAAR